MNTIARTAADEFARRRAIAQAAVAAGSLARHRAEAALRPWLALAVRAGADHAVVETGAEAVIEDYRRVEGLSAGAARWLAADAIAPTADQRAELARARDVAVAKAMAAPACPDLGLRATNLQILAVHFGLPLHTPGAPEGIAA